MCASMPRAPSPEMETMAPDRQRTLGLLNYLFLLGALAVIAGILTAALFMQYVRGELPCPLCLLQRVALFGVAFGIMQNFRHDFSVRNTGLSLLWGMFLLIVAVRQTLLDIYPRPGHEYVGSTVLGLHMPVWSIVIATVLLLAYSLRLAVLGGDAPMRGIRAADFPQIERAGSWLALYVIALGAINLVSALLQCGLGQCHTTGYRLLG